MRELRTLEPVRTLYCIPLLYGLLKPDMTEMVVIS